MSPFFLLTATSYNVMHFVYQKNFPFFNLFPFFMLLFRVLKYILSPSFFWGLSAFIQREGTWQGEHPILSQPFLSALPCSTQMCGYISRGRGKGRQRCRVNPRILGANAQGGLFLFEVLCSQNRISLEALEYPSCLDSSEESGVHVWAVTRG